MTSFSLVGYVSSGDAVPFGFSGYVSALLGFCLGFWGLIGWFGFPGLGFGCCNFVLGSGVFVLWFLSSRVCVVLPDLNLLALCFGFGIFDFGVLNCALILYLDVCSVWIWVMGLIGIVNFIYLNLWYYFLGWADFGVDLIYFEW